MTNVLPVPGVRVADLAWPEIEARLGAGATAVVAVGAASKEHGRHLPSSTDYIQAEWVIKRILHEFPVVVWPTINYGYYPVFVEYPGSVSLPEATFIDLVTAVFDGMHRAGAARAVVFNTGISTIGPLERAVATAPTALSVHLHNVYSGPRFAETSTRIAEQGLGGHADELETSMMLAIAPHRVEMDLARPQLNHIKRGLFRRHDQTDDNYSPDGVNGDPSRASVEKGEALLEALWDDAHTAMAAFIDSAAPHR